jgi:hypothetical protein
MLFKCFSSWRCINFIQLFGASLSKSWQELVGGDVSPTEERLFSRAEHHWGAPDFCDVASGMRL